MGFITDFVSKNKDALISLDDNIKIVLVVVIVLILLFGFLKKMKRLIISGVLLSVLYVLLNSLNVI